LKESVRRVIRILSDVDTYYLIGGAERAWITHWFGGNKDMHEIGEVIMRDAKAVIAQQVYTHLQPERQVCEVLQLSGGKIV
jgi:hypothetical protein